MLLVALALMRFQGYALASMFGNWDVAHFVAIATGGYASGNDVAFFPGWPLVLRGGLLLGIPALVTGTVAALLASAVAAAALYRIGGAPAAIAWLLAPAAVFTMVPYTESLFCAAAFWAWERASSRHWGPAAALAAVAAAVRVSGLFLILALAVLALSQPGARRWLRLFWLAIPAGVMAGYLAYLHLATGSWTAWYDAQAAGWARGFTWPWVSLGHTLDVLAPGAYLDHPDWKVVFAAELASMAAGVVVTLVSLARRRWGEAVWVGSQVAAFSVSYWFMSVNRATLLWFPLWELLGRVGGSRRRMATSRAVLVGLMVALALVLQWAWAWLFFTGRWSS